MVLFFTRLKQWLGNASIRRQLIVGVVAVHAILMTLFVLDMVERQRNFLHEQNLSQANSLAHTLATNSISWILAHDVVGLDEVIQSLQRYPYLRYAMLLDQDGRVLAHSDRSKVGLTVQDETSRSLLRQQPVPRILVNNHTLIDCAVPIFNDQRHIGWARIGLSQEGVAANLRVVRRDGVLFTLAALIVGMMFATWMARHVTRGLHRLIEVSEQTRLGQRDVRAGLTQQDEIGTLSRGFDAMLDAVAESEAQVRLLLDSTAEGIFGSNLEGICIFCNPAAARILGYSSPEDLLGKSMHQLVHHTHADGSPYPAEECRGLAAVRSSTGVHVEDEVFWKADGQAIPVEYWAYPVRRDGKTIGSVVTFSDITERRRTAEKLESQLRFTQTLIDTLPNPIFYKDADLRYVGCNLAYESYIGQSSASILGKDIFQVLPKDLAEMHNQRDRQLIEKGGAQTYETQVSYPDGSRHDMVYYKAVYHRPNGEKDGIVGIMLDVTQLKQAEYLLTLSAKVFENSREAIVIADADNHIITVNQAFTKITGYLPEEVQGKNPKILASGEHGPDFYAAMWQSIRNAGHWQGEIWNRRKNGEVYPEWLSISSVSDEYGKLTHYIGIFADISELKAADERIRFLAQHDALTGLPNRSLLQDRLLQAMANAQRDKEQLAVLFLDLDHFKTINDSLGHHIGDRLLQQVAARLTASVRAIDTVSRQGGDEFVVVLVQLKNPSDAAQLARKILLAISQPYDIDGLELHVTPSIGIAVYPEDGEDTESLIKNADAAMYHAKENGRNNYQYFTENLNTRAFERLTLENSLRRALEHGELLLHYQPLVELPSGAIVGAEALIRWQHPDFGLVPPDRFIPVAEDTGLIVPIGEWVIQEACRQNKAWQDAGLPAIPVAVNLSAMQFRQKNLAEVIGQILVETGLDANYLELELTESAIMSAAESTTKIMHSFKSMGLRLSVDDFGTGYSSLGYLKHFPIDKLKIDRTFVRDVSTDPDDAAIASAVIALAHSLRLKVIAEGVENQEQLEFLLREGCDGAQGYYYSKPLPAAKMEESLRSGNARAH